MSLFQCSKCGCKENTACSNMSRAHFNNHLYKGESSQAALASYREALGLKPDEEFGAYCSACSPMWFDNHNLGLAPNPNPTPGEGLWHGKFPRVYFPLGSMITDFQGNLVSRSNNGS